ncbi:hypothetical protein V6N12_042511 [Hibiscus sabdariffa]|uniref:Uncharacterized protein n=1 Tax=Hibiscus sabdariffa TaxID=183260 RepID=A0ABR2EFF5_9ROSI
MNVCGKKEVAKSILSPGFAHEIGDLGSRQCGSSPYSWLRVSEGVPKLTDGFNGLKMPEALVIKKLHLRTELVRGLYLWATLQGRKEEVLGEARNYFDFVDTLGLIDLSIIGGTFTWSNQRSEEEAILEKLDRVLCSPDWNIFFPKAVALLDVAIGSDHAPFIVYLKGIKRKYKKEFKFESKWLLEEDCTETVQNSWVPISQPRSSHRFGSKLRRTKYSLIRCSKLKSRVNNQKNMELQRKIKSFQGKPLSKEELSESKNEYDM